MESRKVVKVVAAVIEREGKYLITQRKPKAIFPLLWEFPGGKVEKGESDRDALKRELKEEMDVDADVGDEIERTQHTYAEFDLEFVIFKCRLLSDEIKCIGIHDYKWVTSEEMGRYEFPPADEDAIKKLL